MLRIIADSTCDISKEDARKMGIQIVPISVRFGDEEFLDGVEITHEEFYTRLAECDELPKTSQPSPDTFMKVFNEAVAAGDDVLGIFISSDLSGTYQSACLAALDVEEETGKKLYMVDSRSASIGTALLIREAVKLRDAGVNVSDIAAACTEMSKYIKLTAVVGSLKYLKMGGRLSGAAAFAGTMLHITPVVSINKSLNYISDVNGNVGVSSIGCSVGTHVGPGTYGIAYVEAAESGMNRESIVKTA